MTNELNIFDHHSKLYRKSRGNWVDEGLIEMPLHVRYKLESCNHRWARNATYESGQSCITCSCSRGTYNNYRDYLRKQLVNRLQGLLQ